MKNIFAVLLLFSVAPVASQTYFQQEVNYKINVKLDDEAHALLADETVEYINNSPQELTFIYFHLWPNAYKNNETALAKQFVQNQNESFQYTAEKNRGFIDSLNFTSDGKALRWEYDADHIDICKVYLNEPLKPGGRVNISTPFRVKIPGDFSRLGHVGQAYQVSQWYPKPAVYDNKGWHQMPYLDQGEFFSEFGSFEVKITLPKNYRVASTGELQEENEKIWLQNLAKATQSKKDVTGNNEFPASSKEYKTITYKQDNIHDFAWFADKRFLVTKSQVQLPSGRIVDTWAFFLPKSGNIWKEGATYVDSAIHYYSKWVGEYPYNAATAVQGALRAGGGMEYPMVTVISAGGNAFMLDVVVTHEVGHNWFYGILASNERDYTWMDEGFNSYVENRYVMKRYPNQKFVDQVGGGSLKQTRWGQFSHQYMEYLSATLAASYGKQIPINTKAQEMGNLAYGFLSYNRTAALLFYLEKYLGQKVFDNCMHTYYEEWKFKHPYPEDVKRVFEKVSGKDLSWFFIDLLNTANQIDYKICAAKKSEGNYLITVKNVGKVNAPFPIQFIKDGKIIAAKWVEGHAGIQTHTLKFVECDKIAIDWHMIVPELNVHDNVIKTSGMFRKTEPLKLNFPLFVAQNKNTIVNMLPVIGLNSSDVFLVGAAFHNMDVQGKKFNYYMAPMYSTGLKTYAGNFILKYDFLRNGMKVNKLRLMGQYKRFAGYDKLQPSLTAFFRSGSRLAVNHHIQLSYVNIINRLLTTYPANYHLSRLAYQRAFSNAICESQMDINLTVGIFNAPFQSIDFRYTEDRNIGKKSSMRVNVFAGYMINNGASPAFSYFTASSTDYMMNYYMTDRANNGHFGSFGRALILEDNGSFKTVNQAAANSLVSLGFEFSRKGLVFSPYANVGFLDDQMVYDCGLGLDLGIAHIYFPIAGSNFAGEVPENLNNWANSIRFAFRWNIPQIYNNVDKRLNF